ncbi:MAG: O-antigen ligase family protein [Candidatus Omnitrophota bacterium]
MLTSSLEQNHAAILIAPRVQGRMGALAAAAQAVMRKAIFFLFCAYAVLVLFAVGYDYAATVELRKIGALLLMGGVAIGFFLDRNLLRGLLSPAGTVFGAFLLYQGIRLMHSSHEHYQAVEAGASPVFGQSTEWFFFLALFLISYGLCSRRSKVRTLLWSLVYGTVFLLVNCLPWLTSVRGQDYLKDSAHSFYFSFLSELPVVGRMIFGRFAHWNWAGDVIAVGFFVALGLLIYAFMDIESVRRRSANRMSINMLQMVSLLAVIAFAGLAVFAFYSRGTILFFGAALFLFAAGLLLKYGHYRKVLWGLGLLAIALAGFALSSPAVIQEVRTLGREVRDPQSLQQNILGAKAALAMAKKAPVWGVGTGRYEEVFPKVVTEVDRGRVEPTLAAAHPMNHYLLIRAEEGFGAWLYYGFLLTFVFYAVRGLVRTGSRFQFMAGLSVFCPVMMILAHASISQMLGNFNMALLLYLLMGVCLGVLKPGFRHSS